MGAKIKNTSLGFTGEAITFLKNFCNQKKCNSSTRTKSDESSDVSKAFKGPLEILQKETA